METYVKRMARHCGTKLNKACYYLFASGPEYDAAGQPTLALAVAIIEATGYKNIAGDLNMSEGAIKTAVYRLRQRYGQCLRAEIADTVADPSEVDAEVRHLLTTIRPSQSATA